MATVVRAKISEKNKYWIDKHRYYELKHFCLQYREWRKIYASYCEAIVFTSKIGHSTSTGLHSDLTSRYAIERAYFADKIKMIEKAAKDSDDFLYPYILRAVTEGLSYTYLKTKLEIPCGRDMYYDRYRKFFWLLNQARN